MEPLKKRLSKHDQYHEHSGSGFSVEINHVRTACGLAHFAPGETNKNFVSAFPCGATNICRIYFLCNFDFKKLTPTAKKEVIES